MYIFVGSIQCITSNALQFLFPSVHHYYEKKIQTVTVINFTNINKDEQWPLILAEVTEHKNKPRHMTLKIQVLPRDKHKNVAVLIWLMDSQESVQGILDQSLHFVFPIVHYLCMSFVYNTYNLIISYKLELM